MLSSDQQFPYQDDKMIELWFKVMKWFKPDVVDYLGDTDDQACYSKYTEGRSAEFLNYHKTESGDLIVPMMRHEAKGARDFYAKTRDMLPDAQLFSALGNHDIRVFNYVDAKLPEFAFVVYREETPLYAIWYWFTNSKASLITFIRPTAEQINDYSKEIGFTLDGSQFIDHYEARGWLIGKNPMKDWKAAVRTWKRNSNQFTPTTQQTTKISLK